MLLQVINNISNKKYEFTVSDSNDSSLFYHFGIKLEDNMPDGEYRYNLLNEEFELLATGLVQIGNYNNVNKTYTTDDNGYKQYNG